MPSKTWVANPDVDVITVTGGSPANGFLQQSSDSGNDVIISCSVGNISNIAFTYNSADNDRTGGGSNVTANTGSYSVNGAIGTWKGNASSITISYKGKYRITQIVVTYTQNSSGDPTPSSACEMTSVTYTPTEGDVISGVKDEANHRYTITIPYGDGGNSGDGNYLIAYTISADATASGDYATSPAKKSLGSNPADRNGFDVTITAQDGVNSQEWHVEVVRGAAPTHTVVATSSITPELTGTGTQPHVNITDASSNVIESGSSVTDGSTVTFTAVPEAGIVVNSIRNHYVFQKWDDETTTNPYFITVNGADVNRKAYFVRDHHTITYNANGGVGTTPEPIDYECGTFVTLASTEQVSLTKVGYTFWGWNINGTIYGTTVGNGVDKARSGNNFNKDWTATANWIANTYTVTYNENGGIVDPTSQAYTYDGEALEMPVPTKAGCGFLGWFTAATGGDKVTEIGGTYKPTTDITLYAHWEENKVYLNVTENGTVYNLTKTNIDNDAYSGTTQTSSTKDINVDGVKSTYYRTKKSTDYVFVNVKGAKAVVLDVAGGKEGSEYGIIVNDGTVEKFYMGGSTATSDPVLIPESGATIKFVGGSSSGNDLYPVKATFYTIAPSVIKILKNSEKQSSVTQYWNEPVTYDVTTNNTVSAVTMSTTIPMTMASVTYDNATKKLTITPNQSTVKDGDKGTVTLSQDAEGDFEAGEKVLDVEFVWDSYVMTYSGNIKVDLNVATSSLGEFDITTTAGSKNGVTIPALPTLTVKKQTKDGLADTSLGSDDTFLGATLQYKSDDKTLALPGDKKVTIKENAQGIAMITGTFPTDEANHIKTTFATYEITVQDGYAAPNMTNGEKIKPQRKFEVKNGAEETLATVTLGGYKYGTAWGANSSGEQKADTWKDAAIFNAASQGSANYVDGYKMQSQANLDSNNEKGVAEKGIDNKYKMNGLGGMVWYDTNYEKIHPFSLPCRGAYLKLDAEVNGVASVYVLQNGNLNFMENSSELEDDALATSPRVYYWFDQDGNRITPIGGEPVAKQPYIIGNNYSKVTDEEWNTFCSNDGDLKDYLTNDQGGGRIYWPVQATVDYNLSAESRGEEVQPQPVIPYKKGYMVMQKCYVKYVINVIAGKTYYFFSNASKLGYAGINFKPLADNYFAEHANFSDSKTTITGVQDALTLTQGTDNWSSTDALVASKGKVVKSVTLDGRTFEADTWNTICLPFAVDEDQVQTIFGNGTLIPAEGGSIADKTKEVQLMVYNGYKDNTINFLRHVDQNILAGQPYLIRPAKKVIDPTFHNVTIPVDVAMVDYGSTDLYNSTSNNGYYVGTGAPSADPLKLIGTLASTPVIEHDFYINASDGHIYEMSGSTNINAYRAFLQQKNRSNPAKVTSVGFALTDDPEANVGGDTDGIMQILVDGGFDVAPVEGIYSVNGQKVSNSTIALPKGVYIVNGKKIVVK